MGSAGSDNNLSVCTSRNPIFTDQWRTMVKSKRNPVTFKSSKETLQYRKPRTTSEMESDDISNPGSSTRSFMSDLGTVESLCSSLENVSINVEDTRKRYKKRKEERRPKAEQFCHECYEAEKRASAKLGIQAPSPFSRGPWLGHTATGPSGQLTCPLLFFLKKREMFQNMMYYST